MEQAVPALRKYTQVQINALGLVVFCHHEGIFSYGLHQVRPVFNNTRVLNDVTGIPVLGSVSMTWLDKRKMESRLRKTLLSPEVISPTTVELK